MGKKKNETTDKPVATVKADSNSPERLQDFTFPVQTDEGEKNIGFDQNAAMVLQSIHAIDGIILSYSDNLDATEGVLAHTFYRTLQEVGKQGIETIKDRLTAVAVEAGGKIKTAIGELSSMSVAASVEKVFTDRTVALLEEEGLLPQAVEMVATMKEGIDVEKISDEDMEVLKRYFDIDLVPNAGKIDALVKLGKLKAKAVDVTCEEQTKRAGYTRLMVKPTKDFAEYFGLPQGD